MKKLLKTIVLIPIWPLIWASGAEADEEIYPFTGKCQKRGILMLRWRNR